MDTKSLIIEIVRNIFQQKGHDGGLDRGWNDTLFNPKNK